LRYIQDYEKILSNLKDYLTKEEIEKAKVKASEGFEYLMSGYEIDIEDLLKNASYNLDSKENKNDDNSFKRNQEITIKEIKFISTCKHHLTPFFGSCEVIYSPNKKIIGFSRVKKIVKALSLRMQLQENLTREIADFLIKILDPLSLTIKMKAIHTCMMIGGNDDSNEIITVENYKK
jgi:GTP cyclohydrolase I